MKKPNEWTEDDVMSILSDPTYVGSEPEDELVPFISLEANMDDVSGELWAGTHYDDDDNSWAFDKLGGMAQLDLLLDWMGLLQKLYDDKYKGYCREIYKIETDERPFGTTPGVSRWIHR